MLQGFGLEHRQERRLLPFQEADLPTGLEFAPLPVLGTQPCPAALSGGCACGGGGDLCSFNLCTCCLFQNPSRLPPFTPTCPIHRLLCSKATAWGASPMPVVPGPRCEPRQRYAGLLPHSDPIWQTPSQSRLGSKGGLRRFTAPPPPFLPPAASLTAGRPGPGAACQVSLAMRHAVRRSGLLPAASPGRPACLPPAPPSSAALPKAAHGRTLLGAAAGRSGRLHRRPPHPGQQPPVQVRGRGAANPPTPHPRPCRSPRRLLCAAFPSA